MLKIFCIEDNVQEIYLIRHFLNKALPNGFHFDHAPSLKEGLEKLSSEEFNVVVLDLGLHDSVGVMTINKFKSACPDMPVIVYSGDNHQEAVNSIFDAGADAFISKKDGHPSELARVIEVLKSIPCDQG